MGAIAISLFSEVDLTIVFHSLFKLPRLLDVIVILEATNLFAVSCILLASNLVRQLYEVHLEAIEV